MKELYVYRFINELDEVLYVGRTKDLYSRVQGHKNDKTGGVDRMKAENGVEYLTFDNEEEQRASEFYYIDKYQPKFNRHGKNKEFPFESDIKESRWSVADKNKMKLISKELVKRETKKRVLERDVFRKGLMIPADIVKRIEKYQKENYLGSFTTAVVQLIIKGLEGEDK